MNEVQFCTAPVFANQKYQGVQSKISKLEDKKFKRTVYSVLIPISIG